MTYRLFLLVHLYTASLWAADHKYEPLSLEFKDEESCFFDCLVKLRNIIKGCFCLKPNDDQKNSSEESDASEE